jgi:hypothetical protein
MAKKAKKRVVKKATTKRKATTRSACPPCPPCPPCAKAKAKRAPRACDSKCEAQRKVFSSCSTVCNAKVPAGSSKAQRSSILSGCLKKCISAA